jgi:arylsulfatase A-like enzyme
MRRTSFAAILVPLLAAQCSPSVPPRDLNVLLISVDTLRADHLSCYGYSRPTSPSIDGVASEGVQFLNPIAPRGQTWPSVTSLMTSMYPRTHGVRENGMRLDASRVTLPERLREEGYVTAAFLTNMRTAPHRGFDHKEFLTGSRSDEEATQAALEWLGNSAGQRFFAWIHYMAPHKPYDPPAPFDRRFDSGYDGDLDARNPTLNQATLAKRDLPADFLGHVNDLYDGEVARVDAEIGKVLQRLDALGLADDTLVILTADHGEELYEHRHYFFHSCSIYEQVLRIPLIMRLPGRLPEGRQVRSVVEIIDIAPTVHELLSLPVPEEYEGESLLPRMSSDAGDDGGVAFSELQWNIFSIRTAGWHYIYNPHDYRPTCAPYNRVGGERRWSYALEAEELYDIVHDPLETTNVAARRPDEAARLKAMLQAWLAEEAPAGDAMQEIDARALEELRELGYIE